MNQITKISPYLAPRAHAEILERIAAGHGVGVFKGRMYESTIGGEVWMIGLHNERFANEWNDADFFPADAPDLMALH